MSHFELRSHWAEMAIAAALAGQGVALVPRMYVEKELSSGALVAPWPGSRGLSKNFCLVKPAETGINETTLQVFEQWLRSEITDSGTTQ